MGSACDKGEVFERMMQKAPEEAEKAAAFYDYLEVHAKGSLSTFNRIGTCSR